MVCINFANKNFGVVIYYFISDVHLGLLDKDSEEKKEKSLAALLEKFSIDAKEIFILGDLFDYWFEYRRVIQKDFITILYLLKKLTQNGIKVHYIIGNHDFLHRNFFREYLNVKIYENDLEYLIEGKRFYLGHGDGLVKNDIGYLILKKILRNKFIQNVYSLIHPDLGILIAKRTSKKSRDYTSSKSYGEIDGVFEVAKIKIDSGFDFVLFGHTHQRVFQKYNNGIYINLGTWLNKPCYGQFDGKEFQIIDWK